MPTNIAVQLQLRMPTSPTVQQAGQQIQSQLGTATVNIQLKLSPNLQSSITTLNASINALNSSTQQLISSSSSLGSVSQQTAAQLQQVNAPLQQINNSARQTSLVLKDLSTGFKSASESAYAFGEQAGLATRRFLAFSIGAGSILGSLYAFKQGIADAITFQGEMVRLAQVSQTTASEVKAISNEIGNLAQAYGASSSELAKASVSIRQAGVSAKDTASVLQTLAQATSAPNFGTIEESVQGAISAMSQFHIKADELNQTFSSINAVSTQFAVSAKDIQEGILKTGSAFSSAGGNVNEFIALFTSVKATTQESAETIGAGLRNIFTRLQTRETLNALQAMRIELRYTAQEAQALGNVNLTNQFVGPYEAIQRIGQALRGLPATDQRFLDITQAIGSTRNISRALPLIQQNDTQQRALEVAQNAGGSLAASANQGLDSLNRQGKQVFETFEQFYRLVTQSTGFQRLASDLLSVAGTFGEILKVVAPLIPLFITLSSINVAKGASQFASGFVNRIGQPSLNTSPTRYASGGYTHAGSSLLSPGEMVLPPKRYADGGFTVPGVGNQDSELYNLPAGSFVVRKDSAQKIGKAALSRFADGGLSLPVQPYTSKEMNNVIKSIDSNNYHPGNNFYTNFLLKNIKKTGAYEFLPKGSEFIGNGVAAAAFREPNYGDVYRIQPYIGERPLHRSRLGKSQLFNSDTIAKARGINSILEPYEKSTFSYDRPDIEPVIQNLGSTLFDSSGHNTLIEKLPYLAQSPPTDSNGNIPEGIFDNLRYRLGASGYMSNDLHADNIRYQDSTYKLLDVGGLKTIPFDEKRLYKEKLSEQLKIAQQVTKPLGFSGGGILGSIGNFFSSFFTKKAPDAPQPTTAAELIASLPKVETVIPDLGQNDISPRQRDEFLKLSYMHNIRQATKTLESIGVAKDANIFNLDLSQHPSLRNLGVKNPNQLGLHLDDIDAHLSQAGSFANKAGFDEASKNVFKKLGETAALRQSVADFHDIPIVDAQVLPEGFGRKGQKASILQYMGKMLGAGADKEEVQKQASNIFGIADSTSYKYFLQARKRHQDMGGDLDFSFSLEEYDKFVGESGPKKFAHGGISPQDRIPALLTPGEFVFSPEATARIGIANLDRANKTGDASHMMGGQIRGYNRGGTVGMASGGEFKDLSDEEKLQQAIQLLGQKTGLDFSSLKDVVKFHDSIPSKTFPKRGAAAKFYPKTGEIGINRKHAADVEKLTELLLHEGVHKVDYEAGGGQYSSLQSGTEAANLSAYLKPKAEPYLLQRYLGAKDKKTLNEEQIIAFQRLTEPHEVLAHSIATIYGQGTISSPQTKNLTQNYLGKYFPKLPIASLAGTETGTYDLQAEAVQQEQKRRNPRSNKGASIDESSVNALTRYLTSEPPTNKELARENDINKFRQEEAAKIARRKKNRRYKQPLGPPSDPFNETLSTPIETSPVIQDISPTTDPKFSSSQVLSDTPIISADTAINTLKDSPHTKGSKASGQLNRKVVQALSGVYSEDEIRKKLQAAGVSKRYSQQLVQRGRSTSSGTIVHAGPDDPSFDVGGLPSGTPNIPSSGLKHPFGAYGISPITGQPPTATLANTGPTVPVQNFPPNNPPPPPPPGPPYGPNLPAGALPPTPIFHQLGGAVFDKVTSKQADLEKFIGLQIDAEHKNLTATEKQAEISTRITALKERALQTEVNTTTIAKNETEIRQRRLLGFAGTVQFGGKDISGQENAVTVLNLEQANNHARQQSLLLNKSLETTTHVPGAIGRFFGQEEGIATLGGQGSGAGFFSRFFGKGTDSEATKARIQGAATASLLAANFLGDKLSENAGTSDDAARYDNRGSYVTGKTLSSTALYAGIGASIGSVIPGLGTGFGAGIGAAYGAISGSTQSNKEVNLSEFAIQIEKTTASFNTLINSVDRLGSKLTNNQITEAVGLTQQRFDVGTQGFREDRGGFGGLLGFAGSVAKAAFTGEDPVRFRENYENSLRDQRQQHLIRNDPTLTTGINRSIEGIIHNTLAENSNPPHGTIQQNIRQNVSEGQLNLFALGRGFGRERGGYTGYEQSAEFRAQILAIQRPLALSGVQDRAGNIPYGLTRFVSELQDVGNSLEIFAHRVNDISSVVLGGTSLGRVSISQGILGSPSSGPNYENTVRQVTGNLPELSREQFSSTALHLGRLGTAGSNSLQAYFRDLPQGQEFEPNAPNVRGRQLSSLLNAATRTAPGSQASLINEDIARRASSISAEQRARFAANPLEAEAHFNQILAQYQKPLLDLAKAQENIQNQTINAYNQILQITLRRIDYLGKAADTEGELAKNTAQQSSIQRFGTTNSYLSQFTYGQATQGFDTRINQLGNGNFNSQSSINDILRQAQDSLAGRNRLNAEADNGRPRNDDFLRQLDGFNQGLVRARQALELYSSSTTRISYLQEQLRNNQADRDSRISGQRRFILGSDEDRAELVQGASINRFVQGHGDLEAQRTAFNQLGLPAQQTLLRYNETFGNTRDQNGISASDRSNYYISGQIPELSALNQQQDGLTRQLTDIFGQMSQASTALATLTGGGADTIRNELVRQNSNSLVELTRATNELARVQEIGALGPTGNSILSRAREDYSPQIFGNVSNTLSNFGYRFSDLTDRGNRQSLQGLIGGTEGQADPHTLEILNNIIERFGGDRPTPYATGGLVYANQGFFQPRGSDTVPAMLTPGEMVVNQASTAANRGLLEMINNAKGPVYRAEGGNIPSNPFRANSWWQNLGLGGTSPIDREIEAARRGQAYAQRREESGANLEIPDFNVEVGPASGTGGFFSNRRGNQGVAAPTFPNSGPVDFNPAFENPDGLPGGPNLGGLFGGPQIDTRRQAEQDEDEAAIYRRMGVTAANERLARVTANFNMRTGNYAPQELIGGANQADINFSRQFANIASTMPFSPLGIQNQLASGSAAGAASQYQRLAGDYLLSQQLLTQTRVSGDYGGRFSGELAGAQRQGQSGVFGELTRRNRGYLTQQPFANQDQQLLRYLRPQRRAEGGMINGPEGGDVIPAFLSNGEYVMDRRTTAAIGPQNLAQMQRFANGGLVGGGVSGSTGTQDNQLQQALSNFAQESTILTAALRDFSNNNAELVEAMKAFPHTISLEATHKVEVLLNGGEVLARLEPEFRELVIDETKKAIQNLLKDKFPEA